MAYHLRTFDPSVIPDNATCLFIGRRATGKSTCVKDILFHKRAIGRGICMSGTEEANGFWGECIPPSFIYSDYDGPAVKRMLEHQRQAALKLPKDVKPKACFCLAEDVLYGKELQKDNNTRCIFMNGRHWNILFLATMQYALDIPPALRNNIDFVFVFRDMCRRTGRSYIGITSASSTPSRTSTR